MDNTEQFEYGITRSWFDDRCIVVITTQGIMTRAAVDQWANTAIDSVKHWPEDRPVCIMHDLSHPNQGFTPYSLKRAEDIYETVSPSRHGYVAIILRNGPVNSLISLFLRRRKNNGQIQERIFTSRDEGLAWLRQMVAQENAINPHPSPPPNMGEGNHFK